MMRLFLRLVGRRRPSGRNLPGPRQELPPHVTVGPYPAALAEPRLDRYRLPRASRITARSATRNPAHGHELARSAQGPGRDPRRRGDVRGRRFLRRRRAPEARGLRRGRDHAAALRPRRGHPPPRRLLRRPGHPRRPPRRRDDRDPALRPRLRGPVPRGGDRPVRRQLPPGRDADSLRRVQPLDQVPRPADHRPGPRRRRAGDRPLRREPGAAGRRPGAPPRPRSARDQSYFLYATTSEQLDLLRFPLGERPKDETRALAKEFGLSVADKPDSQDICFVPQGATRT